MLHHIASIFIFLAGLVNFLPILAITSADRIARAYGITLSDPNTEILLRHRALLFGLLGGFMMFAAFRAQLHTYAIMAGFVSMVGFILIAQMTGEYNEQIGNIVRADYIALGLLGAALLCKLAIKP
ncbi:hypothetical protein [Parvularcula sp. IMCC14364]|uniref:hypothetical protein n=1 Tax=Parvularcula sp. IMCC14364 TaxID=3067902 RepID=UPI0027424E23|nr:hypothetical protein [Parvularcula sp. IMCC14364]